MCGGWGCKSIFYLLVGFGLACAPVRCAHPSFWVHCYTKRGAARPPAHRSFAASYSALKNISNMGRPRQGLFSIHWTTEAMKKEVPCPPAPPIAASLILPAIFLGSNYVPMRPDALIFLVFLFSIVLGSFLFVVFFFIVSPFPFPFLLILLFLSFSSYLFLFFS